MYTLLTGQLELVYNMKLQLAVVLVLILAAVAVNSAPPRREVSCDFPYELARLSQTTIMMTFDDIKRK